MKDLTKVRLLRIALRDAIRALEQHGHKGYPLTEGKIILQQTKITTTTGKKCISQR